MADVESYHSTPGYCFVKPDGKYLVRYQYYQHHKQHYGWRDTTDVGEATIFPSRRLPKNAKKERGYPRGSPFNWVSVRVMRIVGVITEESK